MFVEKLTKQQIFTFLKTLENYQDAVEIYYSHEMWLKGLIQFNVDFSKEPKRSVPKFIIATDTSILFKEDENWIKYLYSIFGEEYKLWYKNKQEEEFKRLFGDNQNSN